MHEVRTIAELLKQIRRKEILLPEFQLSYAVNEAVAYVQRRWGGGA